MEEISTLIKMSKYAGERFDLVQAGGGNTSVKFDTNKMHIKASGYLLSEMNRQKGFTTVDINKVLSILEDEHIMSIKDKRDKDSNASERLTASQIAVGDRPSIETYLHALLYKYTFHVHAIAVNVILSQKDWKLKAAELDENALCIRYETPGIELALELKKQLAIYKKSKGLLPKVIFLQNHGLIVSSDDYSDIENITESVVCKAEELIGVDYSRYRFATQLSKAYNSAYRCEDIAYLSEDQTINSLLNDNLKVYLKKPFSPDGYVFCGYTFLELKELSEKHFKEYQTTYFERPKLIIFNDSLYIMAQDLKKAKMIEDVLKNNLLILNSLKDKINYLEDSEIDYLGNWEAEKYRQKL